MNWEKKGKESIWERWRNHGHSNGEIQGSVIAAHPFLLIHRGQHIMIGNCKYKNMQKTKGEVCWEVCRQMTIWSELGCQI